MEHSYGICNLSIIPQRAEASDRSELINQLLFGDRLRVIAQEGKWALVQNVYDNYIGWIDQKQYLELTLDEFMALEHKKFVAAPGLLQAVIKVSTQEHVWLTPGSSIPSDAGLTFQLAGTEYLAPDQLREPNPSLFTNEIEAVAKSYLNVPYLWGGRSMFGIDCSGFCQIVFKQFGIALDRDSSLQAMQGELVHFVQEGRAGDLAFFDNEEGKIIHVGILLSDSTIIHASGRVRIDRIDNQGIYSEEYAKYTHRLRIIRRFVS
jgi:gamma-D-glutamyl-L-lysine dipeptidyl-peptidase